MKIALFGSSFPNQTLRSEAQLIAVCKILHKYSLEVLISNSLLNTLSIHSRDILKNQCITYDELHEADIALSVGGDGTFLRTANAIGDSGIPILGINTGRLGFLADINFQDLDETIKELYTNNYLIEERSLLKVSQKNNPLNTQIEHALNEVAILKQDTASMLTLHTYIDNELLTSYQADGLIIATPTGSTAYSLSVGGPILMPKSSSIVLSPIAPHNLTSRPLVVNNDVTIRVRTESRSNTFLVSTDGHSKIYNTSIEIDICKANYTLKVIKRKGHTFYETLRDKLLWGVDVRK